MVRELKNTMQENLADLYFRKLKSYLIPISILLLSVFIVFQVMLPQLRLLSDTNKNIAKKEIVVLELESSYKALTDITDTNLEAHLLLSEQTLPVTKSVVEAYFNLINASIKTDIVLTRFTLKAGNIYDKSKKKPDSKSKIAEPIKNTYEGTVELQASSIDNIEEFSTLLHGTIPLIEIKTIKVSDDKGEYELVFQFRPYDLAKITKETRIKPITENELKLLRQLDEWSKKLEEN